LATTLSTVCHLRFGDEEEWGFFRRAGVAAAEVARGGGVRAVVE
jgi:hypothetical protein